MYRIIRSAVTPWKTKYTVHWLSPDGKDCLLAGNNTLEGAIQSGVDQVEDLLESPWETDERRLLFLENMYIAEGDRVIDTELDDYVDGVMSMISSRMKMKKSANASTKINAWSTTEPSASEYGDFMDDRRKRLNDRFAPFQIKDTYMTRGLANSDGYRITLDVDPQYDEYGPYGGAYEEWILHYNRAQDTYELYGSFEPGDIQDTITLFKYKPIKKVKSLNEAMTYLFNNVDIPDEE